MVATHWALNLQGFYFECLVMGLFQSREATHEYRRMDQSQSGRLNIQPPTNFTTFKDLNELKDVAMRELPKEEEEEDEEMGEVNDMIGEVDLISGAGGRNPQNGKISPENKKKNRQF